MITWASRDHASADICNTNRDGLPVVNAYHFAFRFVVWLVGWLWMTTSFPVPSARQGNDVHDYILCQNIG